jgi:STE24 endopeptidase
LGLITLIYTLIPTYFWLIAWGVVSAFSLFMTMFYSEWIVPIFNKQTPLEAGELRDAIEGFAIEAGFELTNIYVIDGSKRSTKANAYFSGLGAKKRIVLYDTLIKELTTQQIVAVLAHEIGHYKHKHTLSMITVSLLSNLLMFALLGYFVASPELSVAMGGKQASFHLGIMAFGILYSPVSMLLGLAINSLSRRNEYQADAYAASFGLGNDLVNALKKLSSTALSNLQPHPAFVFVHYSHPTLLQRMLAIQGKTN